MGQCFEEEGAVGEEVFFGGVGQIGVILVGGGVDEWRFLIAGMASREFGGQKNGKAHVKVRGQ